MKKILALIIVALVVPSIALAGNKPTDPPGQSKDTHGNSQSAIHSQSDTHSKGNPTVMYVFKGVISNITAGTASVNGQVLNTGATPSTISLTYTCTDGAVTITVKRVNHKRVFKALTDNNDPLTLTFCLDSKTKVIVKGKGKVALADAAGTYNNYGMVKVRYPKKFDPTVTSPTLALQDFLSTAAKQVIVKKAVPTS